MGLVEYVQHELCAAELAQAANFQCEEGDAVLFARRAHVGKQAERRSFLQLELLGDARVQRSQDRSVDGDRHGGAARRQIVPQSGLRRRCVEPALVDESFEQDTELLGIEVAAENVGAVMTYFASHGYERLEKYLDYDTINWYFAPTHPPE